MYRYRNEWKYCLNESRFYLIENKLDKILMLDKHSDSNNKYIIHSLYFDDYTNSCMFDNDAGLGKRYKWRIRYYNEDINFIVLEKKEKLNSLCRKKSCELSIEEFNMITSEKISDLFWISDKELLREFCLEIINRLFKPKVIIDYERTAYVEPTTNVRITFDRNISGSAEIEKFLEGGYTKYPLMEKNKHILEIKFDDILPSYIKQAANIAELKQTTFSKYYLSRKMIERF